MDLILWRHADAEDGINDLQRPLSTKGRKQATKMADWLAAHLPDNARLIASGALRAQQTLAALSPDFDIELSLNPGANPTHYLHLATAETTVIVGHQPEIGVAIASLMYGKPAAIPVKKGSLWWLRGSNGYWELRTMLGPDMV